jgi:hypothetical protein
MLICANTWPNTNGHAVVNLLLHRHYTCIDLDLE